MRQHADDHFGIVAGKLDQFIGDDQRAVGEREGIRADGAALAEVERITALAALGQACDGIEPVPDPVLTLGCKR
ncbi:hypothetical protein D3C72_2235880 [compost metagenome]